MTINDTPGKQPTLSICCIVGDDHLHLIRGMIESLIDRPSGPACQEIVVGWNGKNDGSFAEAMASVNAAGVHVLIFKQQWHNDFSRARQETFEKANGIWRMYIDADDVLALPDDPRLIDVTVKSPAGVPASHLVIDDPSFKGSLSDRLIALPDHVNLVQAPYHYVISDKQHTLIIKRRPRIVRWDKHWAWIGKVHEVLRHALGREIAVWDSGIALIHDPPLSAEDRRQRNFR